MATPFLARWMLLGLGGGAVLAGAYLVAPGSWRAAVMPPDTAGGPAVTTPPLAHQTQSSSPPAAAPASPVPADPPPAAGAAAPASLPLRDPPRFDVVRVGARGVAVVAGRAQPGAEVVLVLDGAQEIGRARADARGEWVILPAEPLAPGSRELSLRARLAGEETSGPDTVIVFVPEPAPVAVAAAAPARSGDGLPVAPAQQERRVAGATAQAAQQQHHAGGAWAAAQPPSPNPPGLAPQGAAAGASDAAGGGRAVLAEGGSAVATPLAVLLPPPVPLAPMPEAAAAGSAAEAAATAALPRVLQGGAGPASAVPRLALEAVEYDDSGAMRFAGTAPPGAAVRIYVDQRHAGDVRADAAGRWVFMPAEPPRYGLHTLRLDQIAASGSVAARIELPFRRERLPASAFVPPPSLQRPAAAAAAPREAPPADAAPGASGGGSGEGGLPPSAAVPRAGRVVVQPGHNLWRIARETYGQGVRYTVIYQANRDQIRDPDLIYPGQIFALPEPHPVAPQPAPAESSRSR